MELNLKAFLIIMPTEETRKFYGNRAGTPYARPKMEKAPGNENSKEYKEMKQYLKSLNQMEDGMSFEEMKNLAETLSNSLQENHSFDSTSNFESEVQQAIENSAKDYQVCSRQGEDGVDYTQTVKNETIHHNQELEDSWDDIDCAISPNVAEEAASNILLVEVDVHHEFDWDPEKDLQQKLETISLNERKKKKFVRKNKHFSSLNEIVEIMETPDKVDSQMKTLKRKRRLSFSTETHTFLQHY